MAELKTEYGDVMRCDDTHVTKKPLGMTVAMVQEELDVKRYGWTV